MFAETNASKQAVLSVTELNRQARRLLEVSFHNIRVEGELSGLVRPGSGHWYFTLKDERAQIRCALFKSHNQRLRFQPSEGMQVQVRGRISLYEHRGDYQLIIDHMEAAGSGLLMKRFEQLKAKLSSEGLFDSEKKRPLPTMPSHIAIITSPTGAAIRDILVVFKRRAPFVRLSVIPSMVQGEGATDQLISALSLAKKTDADAIIIGRGGGSIEDLWSFNEERLARVIANMPIPVISAVGHETDFTIADCVADYRAPTPSAAAEVLSPDRQTLLAKTQQLNKKLILLSRHALQRANERVNHLSKRLRSPGDQLKESIQRLDELDIRSKQAIRFALSRHTAKLQQQTNSLKQHSPAADIRQYQLITSHQIQRLNTLIKQSLTTHQEKLHFITGQLHAISPLATMARGYAIATKNDQIITSSHSLDEKDQITLLLHKGSATCKITQVKHDNVLENSACHKALDNE